jgi:pimeloyl-[acyl-carrier protein] methyl ester esterase
MQGVEMQPSQSDLPVLVLLHGWGYHRAAWPESLLAGLRERFQLVFVDLPSHGEGAPVSGDDAELQQLDAWLTQLTEALPSRFALLGWSLGGQVALRLAHTYPQRVTSLVTIASNLSFVQRDDWPKAMELATLTTFRDAYARLPAKTLQRFCALQAQGANEANMLKTLRSQVQPNAESGQLTGLHWLQHLDGRSAWQQLTCPTLAMLAAADALVPAAVAADMTSLNGAAQVEMVAGCHGLPFDTDLLPLMKAFWEASDE